MKHIIIVLLVLLSLVGSACGSKGGSGTAPIPTVTQVLTRHYNAILSALNSSGVSGTVDFQVTGNVLVVKMKVSGLVPNQKHFQHIHGDGTATCTTDHEMYAQMAGNIFLKWGEVVVCLLAVGG